MIFRLRCYRKTFAEYLDYRTAKAVLARHIWNCPEGTMPWARPLRWGRLEVVDPVSGAHLGWVWTTDSRGEWLDHSIVQMDDLDRYLRGDVSFVDVDRRAARERRNRDE